MFQDRFKVIFVTEGEDEVGLIDDQKLERLSERQISGFDVSDDSRRNSDDDVRQVSDEKLLLSFHAFHVGHVDAADHAAATVG